jgi:guanylate kinase
MEGSIQIPKLNRSADFTAILKNYRPSEASLKTLRQTQVVLVAGTTASGRNTIITELLKSGQYHYLISDTTRPPRMHHGRLEKNGEFYWHISEDKFLEGLRAGRYLEAAIIHRQQVSGTSISEVEKAHSQNKIAITDIENDGVEKLHSYHPGAQCIFLLPPNFESWMDRLGRRGDLAAEEVTRRLGSALVEISSALKCDYYQFLISDNLKENVRTLHEYAKSSLQSLPDQAAIRDHAEQLIIDVQLYLKS